MKQFCKISILILLLLAVIKIDGQISPGDLTHAHADLEGMGNCTQCHDIGNKVPDSKCLACHDEIEHLMSSNRGFHSSNDVKSQECIDCHSEHHGRKFDMVRFDQEDFDHSLTGYQLEGKHAVVDCRQCHIPDFIVDKEMKQRDNTFLGLTEDCKVCHDDFHQGTLGNDCKTCHDIEAFRPATYFDHDDSNFKLLGKHENVSCIDCHKTEVRNEKEFQNFSNVAHSDCIACHDDVHSGHFSVDCKTCHTETSFQTFIGSKRFNHSTTNFELKGSHRNLDCFECHNKSSNPSLVFQSLNGTTDNDCIKCHQDVHDGKFGLDCAKCHNENSFHELNSMDFFDHSLTDYPLEGKHLEVDCKSCHESNYTEAIDFSQCKNCHEDYHDGEFTTDNVVKDCVACHSLHEGFEYTLFTIEDHAEGNFELEGAHVATPCFACHLDEEKWYFRNIGLDCIDCHDNIHKDFMSDEFYPENDCQSCHVSERWSDVSFDHDLTSWKLEGGHIDVDCRDCHFTEKLDDQNEFGQIFTKLDVSCAHCHDNVHGSQFEENGITDCSRCHNPVGWSNQYFDHSTTRFPLEGRHAEIECSACHKEVIYEEETFIEYKIERFECIDCHS